MTPKIILPAAAALALSACAETNIMPTAVSTGPGLTYEQAKDLYDDLSIIEFGQLDRNNDNVLDESEQALIGDEDAIGGLTIDDDS
ncbi:hypothetical protein SAMN04488515_0815 [Cognatiyoonia koreensis]|uniref:EF-hand domain-containing protein n=1 Tax=Cognatiyoonia koreensis TaxID=364200 RepID=A0A1I0NTN9_9RHOB|nr:hypothetical protein [Cognatiyoonia koreensis]SEW04948.1 hypothetical protein SAMN04488515_0815 [Cognatiyoonia koreensis]